MLSIWPDARYPQRPRHDDDVSGARSLLQDQPAQVLAVVVEQFGRPHVAGDDDRILGQFAAAGVFAPSGKLAQQPVGEIVEIVQALAQERVGLARKLRTAVVLNPFHRGLRRQAVLMASRIRRASRGRARTSGSFPAHRRARPRAR